MKYLKSWNIVSHLKEKLFLCQQVMTFYKYRYVKKEIQQQQSIKHYIYSKVT
jgi:hypothetical protein